MKKISNPLLVLLAILSCGCFGCNKYLEKKQDNALTVPTTLGDLQALLDNNNSMNLMADGQGEAAADNYYLTYADWSAMSEGNRNAYVWGDEIVFTSTSPWQTFYYTAYCANTVLENINKVSLQIQDSIQARNIKGQALFFRARAFHTIAICWAKMYDSATADMDLGIPLRMGTDFNEVSTRSSVRQTYIQIISDLRSAISLLPISATHVMRPSRTAAYGLLSRVYLSMGDYVKAGQYADSSVLLNSTLLDFNSLVATASYPITAFNTEISFYSASAVIPILNNYARIDSVLYNSYAANDLRKTVYFFKNSDNSYSFRGNYSGTAALFFGVASDEMYLTKAECAARANNPSVAMATLNALMIKRWKLGTYVPFTAADGPTALQLVLVERRKELVMRQSRWIDLKRLNKEGANITVTRKLNGVIYQLPPNDPRYALPIPSYVIGLTGMAQNPR